MPAARISCCGSEGTSAGQGHMVAGAHHQTPKDLPRQESRSPIEHRSVFWIGRFDFHVCRASTRDFHSQKNCDFVLLQSQTASKK